MISVFIRKQSSFLAIIVTSILISGCSIHPIIKTEPQPGTLHYGQVVYIDDGSCPSGEVKKLTGGDNVQAIPRQVQCVKRPQ
jgi:hypothetical protein